MWWPAPSWCKPASKYNKDLFFQNAVRRLITRKNDGTLTSKKIKNYTGSGKPWTPQESKQFECAMLQHRKDFFVISRMV